MIFISDLLSFVKQLCFFRESALSMGGLQNFLDRVTNVR